MLAKQKIIKTLRTLRRRGEPLNITAVKRRHPELIRAVYAVKPFWGWTQALKDAGINYAKIKIELQETINCELCDKPKRNLANHLIIKHEVKPDEYLIDYPDSELICEDQRANQLRKAAPPVPHWEPCWSREYIMDRTAEYHRRGYPMHNGKFGDIDNSLIMAATRYLGGWKEALIAIGLDPIKVTQEAYRQLHNYPHKEAVIQGIQRRLKKGLRINSTALQRKQGGHRSRMSLFTSGIVFFGSWDNALKAAGMDPEVIHQALKRKKKYETRRDVIREIRARYKRKWAINHGEIYHGKNPECQLGDCAREYFGAWNNALIAAGFNPIKIHRQTLLRYCRYPDKESVLKAVSQRSRKGHLMNYSGITLGSDRDFPLFLAASTFFGSWREAIKRIGLDPLKVKHDAYSRGALKRVGQKKRRR